VHTFASQELRDFMAEASREEGASCIDVLGPLVEQLSLFFQKVPVSKPGLLHQVDEEYFDRVDAIEFAIRHDDGESVADLEKADIVLVGVSRTSKSPLSIYLAQEGWRVANIPIAVGSKLPSKLFQLDQHKVVGLIVTPERLAEARRVRLEQLGVEGSSYADEERIQAEMEYAKAIFEQNPEWPVIDATGKSIEEVSQEVLDVVIGRGRKL
jgi:regulator of PEP synthase PpsR (kinase-PPPase family)